MASKKVDQEPKIVLSGYYGFHNAGDEAILYSIVKQLRQLRPKARLVVLSNSPEHTRETFRVEAVNRWQLPAVLKAVKGADLLISGGGSLLQDVTGPKSIVYYLGVVGIAQALGVPTFFYSQGIGPVRGKLGRRLIPLVANRVSSLTVRDQASASLLAELGVQREIRVTADPVLGVRKHWVDLGFGREAISSQAKGVAVSPVEAGQRKGAIGIALRKWPHLDRLLPALAKWANEVANQGWQIVLLPFHMPEDREISEELLKKMSESGNFLAGNCVLLDGGYTTEQYLSIIGNLDFMISMRLHGLIMAAAMEVPLTGISYDPKIDVFLQQVKQPMCAKMDESLEIGHMLVNLTNSLEGREQLKRDMLERLPQLQEKAAEAAKLALNNIRGE